MTPSRVIRPSSLTTAADCARRWAANHLREDLANAGYTLAADRPTHVGAAVGSGVHAGAAYTLEEIRRTGEIGSDTEAEDRAVAEFQARTEYGVDWDDTTSGIPVAKRQIARMTRVHRQYLAPEITPIEIEERLEADIGDGWTLSGQTDTWTGNPDVQIRDLKTGARRRANGMQYGAYAMLLRAHGYRVIGLQEDFIARVNVKAEQPAPVTEDIPLRGAVSDAAEVIEDIRRMTAEFERRLADPSGRAPHAAFRANPASSLCGPRWCRAWGTDFCTAHRR